MAKGGPIAFVSIIYAVCILVAGARSTHTRPSLADIRSQGVVADQTVVTGATVRIDINAPVRRGTGFLGARVVIIAIENPLALADSLVAFIYNGAGISIIARILVRECDTPHCRGAVICGAGILIITVQFLLGTADSLDTRFIQCTGIAIIAGAPIIDIRKNTPSTGSHTFSVHGFGSEQLELISLTTRHP